MDRTLEQFGLSEYMTGLFVDEIVNDEMMTRHLTRMQWNYLSYVEEKPRTGMDILREFQDDKDFTLSILRTLLNLDYIEPAARHEGLLRRKYLITNLGKLELKSIFKHAI
jgi:DNA-binding PadR family transcriptional regulator